MRASSNGLNHIDIDSPAGSARVTDKKSSSYSSSSMELKSKIIWASLNSGDANIIPDKVPSILPLSCLYISHAFFTPVGVTVLLCK